jgi:hypothetical protein
MKMVRLVGTIFIADLDQHSHWCLYMEALIEYSDLDIEFGKNVEKKE